MSDEAYTSFSSFDLSDDRLRNEAVGSLRWLADRIEKRGSQTSRVLISLDSRTTRVATEKTEDEMTVGDTIEAFASLAEDVVAHRVAGRVVALEAAIGENAVDVFVGRRGESRRPFRSNPRIVTFRMTTNEAAEFSIGQRVEIDIRVPVTDDE